VIKSLILKFLMSRLIAPLALRWAMNIHNSLYNLSGILAIVVNGGEHPKHRLLRYQEWFSDHIESGWVILDIGSNTGSMAAMLAKKAHHVYGIEIIPSLVEIAKQKYVATNLEFLTGDATSFNYSMCQPIDCVTLSNVLEHISNRSVFLTILRQQLIWRNSSQCNFLIRVPTIERDWLVLYKKEMGVEYRLDLTHEIEYTRDTFLEDLYAAGLQVVSFDVRFGEFYVVCKGKVK